MKGNLTVPFSALFKDTLLTHGLEWAFGYYVQRNKMALQEFRLWCRVAYGLGA